MRATPEVRVVREEERTAGPYRILVHAEWEAEFPGLVAGITSAGPDADFGLATVPSAAILLERFDSLARALGVPALAVCRQVHGSRVVAVEEVPPAGFLSPGAADGMACGVPGVLLGVTAADCVPAYLLDPATRVLALLHAGWRGVAAGVLEAAAWLLASRYAVPPGRLRVHLGPAICGACYEVGGDVLGAFGRPGVLCGRVDLRGELAARAAGLGIEGERITLSEWCTRCHSPRLHSHRAGARARMLAVLGWRAPG